MKDLNKLYCECIKELDSIGVKYGNIVSVVVNTRAKKRWGQCKIVRNASCWADMKSVYQVDYLKIIFRIKEQRKQSYMKSYIVVMVQITMGQNGKIMSIW